MSIETWKAEFYPVPASEVSAEDALQHSLRKWIGLREESLSKHACDIKGNRRSVVYEDMDMFHGIGGESCALCVSYYTPSDGYECSSCPIVKLRGETCDAPDGPWIKWVDGEGPEPMIAVLQECIAEQEKEKA